jgi:hypothetical protein
MSNDKKLTSKSNNEVIIRNKNRNYGSFDEKFSSYQPEYERLNIAPEKNLHHVDRMDFVAKKPQKREMLNNHTVSSAKKSDNVAVNRPIQSGKKQPFVHSGQNEELLWPNSLRGPDKKESFYDWEKDAQNSSFEYEDVQTPETQENVPSISVEDDEDYFEELNDSQESDEEEQTEQKEIISLADVNQGSYILFWKDNVLEIGTKQEIEKAIENLLFTNENSDEIYKNLFVLKKMNILTGIFISDG